MQHPQRRHARPGFSAHSLPQGPAHRRRTRRPPRRPKRPSRRQTPPRRLLTPSENLGKGGDRKYGDRREFPHVSLCNQSYRNVPPLPKFPSFHQVFNSDSRFCSRLRLRHPLISFPVRVRLAELRQRLIIGKPTTIMFRQRLDCFFVTQISEI